MTPEEIAAERTRIELDFLRGMLHILSRRLREAGGWDDQLRAEIRALSKAVAATVPPGMPRLEREVVMARLRRREEGQPPA
jgi:hypothetical protein